MQTHKLNFGCGPVFVDSAGWINPGFSPASSALRKANLHYRLPLAEGCCLLVYSSRFLKHVLRDLVPCLLREGWQILLPGGMVRLVVPNLEDMVREYLSVREAGEHEKVDFVVLKIIDQFVLRDFGGELDRLYRQITSPAAHSTSPVCEYIRLRIGKDLRAYAFPVGGGGAAQRTARVGSLAPSHRARLDSTLPACAYARFPGAKRQLCGGGRAAPLAVGLPSAQGRAGGCRYCRCATVQPQQQQRGQLHIPAAGPRCRGASAQGGGVNVGRGTKARLTISTFALLWGGCNG